MPFFADLCMMKYLKLLLILLIYNALWASNIHGQTSESMGIRLKSITFLTSNLDSLTRAFIKRGYHIKQGKREADGIFNNSILLQNGCEMILETTLSSDPNDWRNVALTKYRTHISGIAFEVDHPDSFHDILQFHSVPVSPIMTSTYRGQTFALDSCFPLDVVFYSKDTTNIHSPEMDSLSHHRNNVYRFDWVLLSAGSSTEKNLRKVFEVISTWKLHEGCCDFWRVGPSNDFCFFRFEPPIKKAKGISDWLSIEPDNIYFAY